ncbi:MAG: glycoside hydrolase family 31 protein [Bacteroidia bacterium]
MEVTQTKKDYPKPIHKHSANGNRFHFEAANAKLEVTVLTDSIIRFRFAPDLFARDFSYAINPGFNGAAKEIRFHENEINYEIFTSQVHVLINKETLEIKIEDLHGKIISEDKGGFHFEENKGFGGYYVYCSKKIQQHESFFGLGDKPTDLNLRGKRFLNWGTDTYGFAKEQDPLYRNIPFYYGLHHGRAYGIFFDNTFQTFFDFGHENAEVMSFWAEGGEMNYYFVYGPELISVAEQYAQLTGTPELPPMWALGYQQSKWSYYPEAKVWEIAHQLRSKNIPCDVIHLDIDYMNGFRCFTWDNERFPNPAHMISELKKFGFNIVTIIDPGIKIDPDYFVYKEALEKNYFCKRQDGDLMKGKVWPGECNFPDFTNPEVRDWWQLLFEKFVGEQGVKGIWNDMNEPAVFEIGTFPDDVRHNFDGLDVSHRRAHNIYGMQMARASYEGTKRYAYPHRPFVLTRSGYSGVQRYSSVWTGDNVASWEHLWIANMQCQRLSVSGISFCGTDIGGFIGEPDGELFVRYIQMAVFHPFFRGHSSSDQGDKEPWTFGETYEPLIRKAIELRYRLLPYIYTVFWQYVSKGTPMIRPLSFIDQHDSHNIMRQEEFGFGDQLLICPIAESAATGRKMYLPKGNWVNYFTDKVFKGSGEIYVEAALGVFPLFVKSGAVIPHYAVMQYVAEKKINELALHVYYSETRNKSFLYEDENDFYNYKDGKCSIKKFTVFGNRKQLRIVQNIEGHFETEYGNYQMIIHCLPFRPKGYQVDGTEHKLPSRAKEKNLSFSAPKNFKRIEIY